MNPLRTLRTRGFALALLAIVASGPAGVAGLLHPFDDIECAPISPRGAQSLDVPSPSPSGDNPHCPTCHLLRSVRWSVSVDASVGFVPASVAAEAPAAQAAVLLDRHASTGGRSPPARA
jgi:hypothetical protein